MRVWDRATGTCIATLTGHTEPLNAVAISPGRGLVRHGFPTPLASGEITSAEAPESFQLRPGIFPQGKLYRDRTAIRVGKLQVSSFQLTIPTWGLRSVAALFQRGECACLAILPCAVALRGPPLPHCPVGFSNSVTGWKTTGSSEARQSASRCA
ncbi:hypothetical protein AB0N56_35455 [Streptomyces microflavus]|uniref:hypothetical protein n=1 Tax=Streptomyces microflavus TaxID=1919 RepID=UPI00343ABE70